MSATLVRAHRRDIDELLGMAVGDLNRVWRQVNGATAARDALMDLLPALVELYGSAAATLGADWYDEMRETEGTRGRFRAIPATLPDRGRTDSLARWGVDPLFQAEPDLGTAQRLVAGGFQRIIADADRDTVIGSLTADPQGQGWRRETNVGACKFCVEIAGRGNVYSAKTADFASHDACGCFAVPVVGGQRQKVQPYTPSQRFRTADQRSAHNARLRDWMSTLP